MPWTLSSASSTSKAKRWLALTKRAISPLAAAICWLSLLSVENMLSMILLADLDLGTVSSSASCCCCCWCSCCPPRELLLSSTAPVGCGEDDDDDDDDEEDEGGTGPSMDKLAAAPLLPLLLLWLLAWALWLLLSVAASNGGLVA